MYHFKSFEQISAEFSVCVEQLGEDTKEQEEMVSDCLKDTFYGPIEYGFELVFGANTSPGFVCGVKEAVADHGETLPGYCCLVRIFALLCLGRCYCCCSETSRLTLH